MTTPVLFLDDASRHAGQADRTKAERTVITLLDTLKRLRKINKRFALNTARPIAHYQVADNWTLQAILGGRAFKEEWDFIRLLNDRSPFAAGLEVEMLQVIDGMECRTRAYGVASGALAWAMLLESATVSLDGHPDWSQAWVETAYTVLEDDETLSDAEGLVRNASQAAHADIHVDWLKLLGLSRVPTAAQLWSERAERFPGVRFLPQTRKNIERLEASGAPFLQAISALESLANDVRGWGKDVTWPEFSTKATAECEQRKRLCWFHDNETGKRELFDWHIRFTGSFPGRVHFRVDGSARTIVVGYVGRKLTN